MAFKFRFGLIVKLLTICLALTGFITLLLATTGFDRQQCNNSPQGINLGENEEANTGHHLAVLVPFRDRFDELLEFAPYLDNFLNNQNVRHTIYIINQADGLRFNRASLINSGFLLSRDKCDYIAMHDVDLLPINTELSYAYPENGPFHLASPEYHPRYNYAKFVGGILLLKRDHFELLNGLSNNYWGWGLEDDEFYLRIKEAGLNITRPKGLTTSIDNTFKHIHDKSRRKRDMAKLFNQKEVTRRRDRLTGLNTVQFVLREKIDLKIKDSPVVVLNVELQCNRTLTPWCELEQKVGLASLKKIKKKQ